MSRNIVIGILLLLLLIPATTACGDEANASEPPDLTLGESVCSHCGMIISDERFASGITTDEEDPLLYDDLGEMVMMMQMEDLQGDYIWVHDYNSQEWIDATAAWYVASPEIMAPMGSQLAAFDDEEAANTFSVTVDGDVYSWENLLSDWQMPARMH